MNNFFDIKSVAIIGASSKSGKIGNDLLKNLENFKGEKMGVNPNGGEFKNIKFYKNISSLPKIPDIAVIAIPAKFVIDSVNELGRKGVKRVIIISAGFKETGNIKEENEIKTLAKKYNMKILGPNCLGFIDIKKNLNLSFGGNYTTSGDISLISQSGAMAVALIDWAVDRGVGFSKIISMGNKADLSENDILLELENDPSTKVILIYLESIEDGRKFYEITRELTISKPIIMIKSGISKRGQKAASSHTGALSGEIEILNTATREANIHTTSSLEEFFLWGETFSKTGTMKIEDELVIITNAGGPGVMTTDHCEKNNIILSEFSEQEKKVLQIGIPNEASIKNPIDIIGDAKSDRYKQMLDNLSLLNKKRSILILLTPQASTDCENIAKVIINFEKENPDILIMTSFMGGEGVKQARQILKKNKILDYDYPKKAIITFSKLLKQQNPNPSSGESIIEKNQKSYKVPDKGFRVDYLREKIIHENKLASSEFIKELFEKFEIDYISENLIKNENDIEKIWKDGTKMIAKISSPDIAHKTDVGGIIGDIRILEEAKIAYKQITKNVEKIMPEAKIEGVIFQEMLKDSKEIFVGLKRDINFGDVLLVGMGGIYVNIYKDITRKLLPASKDQIKSMFNKLHSKEILHGTRGEKSIDFHSLVDNIYKITQIFQLIPEIKEVDINPILANKNKSVIVDTKLYLI